MGKQKNTSLKVKGFTIYPLLLRKVSENPKEDFRGINIRVTDKKKTVIDIECYDNSEPQRIRITSRPDYFNNGKITGGYSEATVDKFNTCLHSIQTKIAEYIEGNTHLKKPLLMSALYGANFAISKKKRTKYVTIPVQRGGVILDSYEITSKEVEELLAPHFSKQTFINSDGKSKTIEGIFDSDTGESMIESEDDIFEIIDQSKNQKEYAEKTKKEKERITQLTTEEKYKQGHFNHDNLLDIFIAGYFQEYPNDMYKKGIVWRLSEYIIKAKPPVRKSDFSVEWCKDFLSFIFKNGMVQSNFKHLDFGKLSLDSFKGKTIFYSIDNRDSVIKWLKDAIRKLNATKLLPKIDLDDIRIKDFYSKDELKNIDTTPQDEKAITKHELDKLFNYEFKNEELNLTRDRFILMIMIGGLRINEFRADKIKTGGALSIEDDGYGHKFISYYSSHNQKLKEMANPINEYVDGILKKYGYEIPFYVDKNSNPIAPNEPHFNQKLKEMAKAIGIFKRKVKDKQRNENGVMETVKISIEDDMTSLYARHSIYPIFKYKGMPHEEVMYFVGHSGKKNSSNHYNPKMFKDHQHKRKQLDKYGIRPE